MLCQVFNFKKINQDVHYRMTEKLQSYYLSKVEPFRSCLLALREIILDHNPVITETQKYFMPCFCYKKDHLLSMDG